MTFLKILELYFLLPFIRKLQNVNTLNCTFFQNMDKDVSIPNVKIFKVKLTIPLEITGYESCYFVLLNLGKATLFNYWEK